VAQALEIREQQQQLAADQRSKHHGTVQAATDII
jgi:hypothetical protein